MPKMRQRDYFQTNALYEVKASGLDLIFNIPW